MKYWSNYPADKHLLGSYDPLVEEKKILAFWSKKRTFEKIQGNRCKENDGTFVIHCGPTFPTGSPHIGHVLNATVKDAFMRYGFQKKLQVDSQFGWDCHGLAVEHEVDKKLGIKAPEDVGKIGIATYNEECRKFVQRHQAEWSNVFERMGIWVDFSAAYSTMSVEYMESVWRVFKELYEKGLVYKGTKVLPYSTSSFTHLSGFEAEQNWKEITEVGAKISLNIVNSSVKLLIWTTAPWTLVANVAVCVNRSAIYVKVKVADGNEYIVSKNRLVFVFTESSDYVVLEEINGKQLENLRYHPLFGSNANTFPVMADECIRDDLGTGLVAISPHFAEEDFRICLKNGVNCDEALCPVDDSGHFKQHVPEVAGLGILEANDVLIETLKRFGHVVRLDDVKHRKAHCWRSDVPLIDKVTSTWFIKTEGLCDSVGDWAVGRTRYWGTPLPIWVSPNGDEVRVIGSIDELSQLTGAASIPDLHREFVDELVIPSRIPGNPPLRRVPEVFDCWFESGVMPFIQQRAQADLIAEGSDQSCGWFHTTSVLSAALSQPPPSKNILSHGLVLGSDGTKVSKRKHNNSDPLRLVDKYGADALRMHLVTNPLVTGENFTPQEHAVGEMVQNVIKPLYQMVLETVPCFGKKGWVSYGVISDVTYVTDPFEKWMLSRTESLLQFYDAEMSAHRLNNIIPRIVDLLKLVEDWYVPIYQAQRRRSRNERQNYWDDKVAILMFNMIFKISLALAPFAPFFTEHIYQILEPYVGGYFHGDFIHDCLLTEKSNALVQVEIERKVMRWQKVIELVRKVRASRVVPIQYRISEVSVVHPTEGYLEQNEVMDETMMEMINVHQIRRTSDRHSFGATFTASLKENSLLHLVLRSSSVEELALKLSRLSDGEVDEVVQNGSLDFEEHKVSLDDIQLCYQFENDPEKNQAIISEDDLIVVVTMNKDLEYYAEGTRLELISSVQRLRRTAKVFPSERVKVGYSTKDDCLRNAFAKYSGELVKRTNSRVQRMEVAVVPEENVVQEVFRIKGASVTLYLFKE